MSIRIGTYNVNNLFRRAAVMELDGFSKKAKNVLEDVGELNGLLAQDSYAGAVGAKIKALLQKYEFHKPQKEKPWFTINEVRGKLFSVKKDSSGVTIAAKGWDSWVGWVAGLNWSAKTWTGSAPKTHRPRYQGRQGRCPVCGGSRGPIDTAPIQQDDSEGIRVSP